MSYTVSQLAKMYNTTRQTIHTKLKHPDMSSYIIRQSDKVLIDPSGLNVFNTIMSTSKVVIYQNDSTTQSSMSQLDGTDYKDLYIKELQKQIESLNIEKESWHQERKQFLTNIENISKNFSDIQKFLPAPKQNKRNKRFWLF